MNEKRLIPVLQGITEGKKWGYRVDRGLVESKDQSFNALLKACYFYAYSDIELIPETRICNGIVISAPLTVAPMNKERYYIASPYERDFFSIGLWLGCDHDMRLLERGLLHATKEPAELHGRAMAKCSETN